MTGKKLQIQSLFRVRDNFFTGALPIVLPALLVVVNFVLEWPITSASAGTGERSFGDLYLVLESGQCFTSIGYDVYSSSATAGLASCPTYVYGSFPLLLSALLGGLSFGYSLGVLQAVLFAALFGLWCRRLFGSNWWSALVAAALVVTPPIQLLMVRGNLDIWVGILILVAMLQEGYARPFGRLASLALATLVKFYTLPLLIVASFFALQSSRRTPIKFGITTLAAMTVLIVFLDLVKIESLPTPTEASFGILSLDLYLKYFNLQLPVVAWFMSLLLMLIPLLWAPWRRELARADGRDAVFLEISVVFLFVYFAAQNYDHRLFLVAFLVAMALKPSTELPRMVALAGYASLWLSSALGIQFARASDDLTFWTLAGSAQALGDALLAIFVGAIVIRLTTKVVNWLQLQRPVRPIT